MEIRPPPARTKIEALACYTTDRPISQNNMSSAVRSRLNKQSRVFCGHCNEYLSRATFWRHRRLYYDVHSERWTAEAKDYAQQLKQNAKRPKCASELSEQTSTKLWSDSSGNEDVEATIPDKGIY